MTIQAPFSPTDPNGMQSPYDDSQLIQQTTGFGNYNPNQAGSWQRGVNSTIDNYLTQLSPQDLLSRYQFIQSQNPSDFSQFSTQRYGSATAKDQAYYTAYKTAQDVLGRSLTAQEFAQIAPIFGNGSSEEVTAGRAYLANMAQQQKQNPLSPQNQTAAQGKSGDINGVFQELLNRGATQEEIQHFGSLLASGQTDAYELSQFVKQLPEYQQGQDKQFRQGLDQELQNSDAQSFKREAGNVISDYGNRGIYNSPSLDYALTDLMGKVAQQRQSFLTGLSANQYQGNKDSARQDYQTQQNQMFANQDYNKQRTNQVQDQYMNRSFQVGDYNRQMSDMQNLLNSQRRGGYNPFYGLAGGLVGAGVGGFAGGSAGAGAGYQIGQGVGNGFNYLNY